jgi:hypothetical protein
MTGAGAEPQRLARMGDQVVDVPIMCSITRFGLRSPRMLLPTLRDYRRLLGNVRNPESFGFLKSAFLIENPTTCYSFSIWSEFPSFSANVSGHVQAARGMFGRLSYDSDGGPELWSTKWRLVTVSNNLNWQDFDLRHIIEPEAE